MEVVSASSERIGSEAGVQQHIASGLCRGKYLLRANEYRWPWSSGRWSKYSAAQRKTEPRGWASQCTDASRFRAERAGLRGRVVASVFVAGVCVVFEVLGMSGGGGAGGVDRRRWHR